MKEGEEERRKKKKTRKRKVTWGRREIVKRDEGEVT